MHIIAKLSSTECPHDLRPGLDFSSRSLAHTSIKVCIAIAMFILGLADAQEVIVLQRHGGTYQSRQHEPSVNPPGVLDTFSSSFCSLTPFLSNS
jgi:hypothetical protein